VDSLLQLLAHYLLHGRSGSAITDDETEEGRSQGVCGHSLAGIAGLNSAEGIDVSVVCRQVEVSATD
jgi:hypothetical protein